MNDQLIDASNKQLLLDIMQYWAAGPLWWVSRMLLWAGGACEWLTDGFIATAHRFWLPTLLGWIATNLWVPLLSLAIAGASLTLLLFSVGIKTRWIRLSAIVRWPIILVLFFLTGIPAYVGVETAMQRGPALVVGLLRVPTLPPSLLTVVIGGESSQPYQGDDPAQRERGRIMRAVTASGPDQTYTAEDIDRAIWRASVADIAVGGSGVRVDAPDGPVVIDGLPTDYALLFFPPSTVPWYGGDYATDPNGAVKRQEAVAKGSAGVVSALLGTLGAFAALLPVMIGLIFAASAAGLLLVSAVLAPLGLFGNNSMWVGALLKSWVGLAAWRFAINVASLLLSRLLFGSVESPGLATVWPLAPVFLILYGIAHVRLFKAAWRAVGAAFSPVRTAIATVRGNQSASAAADVDAGAPEQTDRVTDLRAVTPTAIVDGGVMSHTDSTTGAPDSGTRERGGGFGLMGMLISGDQGSITAHSHPQTGTLPGVAGGLARRSDDGATVAMTAASTGGPSLGHRTTWAGQYQDWVQDNHISNADSATLQADVQTGHVAATTIPTANHATRTRGALFVAQMQGTTPPTVAATAHSASLIAAPTMVPGTLHGANPPGTGASEYQSSPHLTNPVIVPPSDGDGDDGMVGPLTTVTARGGAPLSDPTMRRDHPEADGASGTMLTATGPNDAEPESSRGATFRDGMGVSDGVAVPPSPLNGAGDSSFTSAGSPVPLLASSAMPMTGASGDGGSRDIHGASSNGTAPTPTAGGAAASPPAVDERPATSGMPSAGAVMSGSPPVVPVVATASASVPPLSINEGARTNAQAIPPVADASVPLSPTTNTGTHGADDHVTSLPLLDGDSADQPDQSLPITDDGGASLPAVTTGDLNPDATSPQRDETPAESIRAAESESPLPLHGEPPVADAPDAPSLSRPDGVATWGDRAATGLNTLIDQSDPAVHRVVDGAMMVANAAAATAIAAVDPAVHRPLDTGMAVLHTRLSGVMGVDPVVAAETRLPSPPLHPSDTQASSALMRPEPPKGTV